MAGIVALMAKILNLGVMRFGVCTGFGLGTALRAVCAIIEGDATFRGNFKNAEAKRRDVEQQPIYTELVRIVQLVAQQMMMRSTF